MNVVFLNPPNIDSKSYIARSADRWPHRVQRGRAFKKKMFPKYPLYMMYGAAVLKRAGHSVSVIDAAERDYTHSRTLELIREHSPQLVVVEISDPSRESDLKMVAMLKGLGVMTGLIGTHATVFENELMAAQPEVDYIVRGEFFDALEELVNALDNNLELAGIAGISFRQPGGIRRNPDREQLADLDELPYPARELLDPRRYLMGHYTYSPQLLMVTSMGCPSKCIFCLWPKLLYNGKVRLRKPDCVVDEMQLLIDQYGAREIYFDDDVFNVTEQRIYDICQAILDAGVKVPWITEMRCDHLSQKSLRMMKRAGCVKILFGVESGVQDILDASRKKITLEQVTRAFQWAENAGIRTHATFMFGLPGETRQTIEQTIQFAKRINSDTIQCSIALPYPGTDFYEMSKSDGTLRVDNWIDFDGELCGAVGYDNLSKEEIRSSVNRMYKEFYTSPRHILKQVVSVRSASDIKRLINLGTSGIRRFF